MTASSPAPRLNPQDYDFRSNSITDFTQTTMFSPWKFGSIELPNRFVKSAAGSDTGSNPEECVAYYRAFAHGGVPMVWVEDFVDKYEHFPHARGVAIEDSPLEEIAKAIHEEAATSAIRSRAWATRSAAPPQLDNGSFASSVAGDMSLDEIHLLQQDSAAFAKKLQDIGFDAVEINAAGNNIGQSFFSRMRNRP